MSDRRQFTIPLQECADTKLAGGKAVNLGILLRAGFPVPGGFVVSTEAYRAAGDSSLNSLTQYAGGGLGRGHASPTAQPLKVEAATLVQKPQPQPSPGVPEEGALAAEILAAYESMGRGLVAVRSSATAEDMAGASMAGQYDTFLHVHDDATLLDAVRRCWASLDSPRTRSYLSEHGIDINQVSMAVVVQRLVRADVSGVLFTANPRTGNRTEMLAEATWGLGEALVSGRVQPDVLRINRDDGALIEQRISDKRIMISPASEGEIQTPDHLRHSPCLEAEHRQELWRLGKKGAEHFGAEQDIEWAVQEGKLYLLQSRPITTLEESDAYERILRDTRGALEQELASGKGPWVRHNLGETLPHPTPLTWSVMQRFMTGGGGFGHMYCMGGFAPSAAASKEGFLKLIAGRVYMDTTRAAGMFFEGFPFRYDIDALRTNPDAAQAPPTIPDGSLLARWKVGRRIGKINARLARRANDLDRKLRDQTFPDFKKYLAQEKSRDLRAMSAVDLIALWKTRHTRVMEELAPMSLLPSLVEGMVLSELREFLAQFIWDRDPDELAMELSSSPVPNMTLLADAGLFDLAIGRRSLADWLTEFGHRAAGEFDLATPRWREQPAAVETMAKRLAGGADPRQLHEGHASGIRKKVAELRSKLTPADGEEFDRRLDRVWRYIAFREDGKYYLMLGYDLLRDVAMEAGRRLGVGADVFYLTEQEMLAAVAVSTPSAGVPGEGVNTSTIVARKRDYRAEVRISLPHVIDSGVVENFGAPPSLDARGLHEAFAVSAGSASGPARIVLSPADAGDLGKGYVLVCPSTDPNWTPLFVNAAALVLECGGTLSHGAVVAREMGLPAVVLADATRIFAEGQMLRVDGHHGAVGSADARAPNFATDELADETKTQDGQDTKILPQLVPPPPGPKDLAAARWRNAGILIWGVYLALAFLLPEDWLYQPSLKALDALFWPMIPMLGKPLTVAVIAAGLAILTMVLQRLMTDNPRLVEAKWRSNLLSHSAAELPQDSPRRAAIGRLTMPVQIRLFSAAMAPMGVLLGPMVMTFFWFPARVDPASWNAPPGTQVQVVGMVRASGLQATLDVPAALKLDDATPPEASVESITPVSSALQELLAAWQAPAGKPIDPTLRERIETLQSEGHRPAELQTVLTTTGIEPRPILWSIHPPPEASGRWPVTLHAPGMNPLTLDIVLGDAAPPAPTEIETAHAYASTGRLKVTYVGKHPGAFWQPWHSWDTGWLIVYLLAYLPAMYLARRALKIA